MKYTAQQLKRSLSKNDIEALNAFKVNKYDREYYPDCHREEKKYKQGKHESDQKSD